MRPDDFKCPDVRQLIQVAQTEQGQSEISCVFEPDHPDLARARPMILTDDLVLVVLPLQTKWVFRQTIRAM